MTPEPAPDERAALLAALAEAGAEDEQDADPWAAAARREAVEKELDSP